MEDEVVVNALKNNGLDESASYGKREAHTVGCTGCKKWLSYIGRILWQHQLEKVQVLLGKCWGENVGSPWDWRNVTISAS